MPWTAGDATQHTKAAKTDKLKKQWASVANSVRAKCIKDGGSEKECDAKAIRIANSSVSKVQENQEMDNEWTMASVAQVAIEVGLAVARETDEIANSDAAKKLDLLRSKWGDLSETATQAPIVSIADVEVDGERVLLSDIVAFYRAHKTVTEKEEEVQPEEPKDKMPSVEHLKLYAIEAIDVIRTYFDALDIPLEEQQEPYTGGKDSDTEVTVESDEPVVEEPLIEFDEGAAEAGSFEIGGHALLIAEDVESESRAAPLKLNFVVIEPGFGNKKMKRYYPAPMLRESAAKFKGAKMYTTNHKAGEKNVRDTEVGVVLECPVGFTETGGVIAQAGIWDASFARNIRNRAELGALSTLENSVLGEGDMRKGKVNGKQAYIVEDIKTVESVDWVTKAGAGGRALEIVENDEEGGSIMTEGSVEDVVEEVVEEQVTETEVEETDPSQEDVVEVEGEVLEVATIAEAIVAEEVDKTSLPEAFKIALKVREYADADELAGAITKATDDFKAATGSGKPFGQGQTKRSDSKPVAEGDEDAMKRKHERLNRILAEVGHSTYSV